MYSGRGPPVAQRRATDVPATAGIWESAVIEVRGFGPMYRDRRQTDRKKFFTPALRWWGWSFLFRPFGGFGLSLVGPACFDWSCVDVVWADPADHGVSPF